MSYAIIDPFISNRTSQIVEVFHTRQYAEEFLQRRIEEEEDAWAGCLIEKCDDNTLPFWVIGNKEGTVLKFNAPKSTFTKVPLSEATAAPPKCCPGSPGKRRVVRAQAANFDTIP